MSLQRVASLETFQSIQPPYHQPSRLPGSRRGSDASSTRPRKLSFNPLPDEWDPHDLKLDVVQAVSAFDVPSWKRVLQVIVAVVYCLFAAGIVFGYAAIKPVLKHEGAYQDVCRSDSDVHDGDSIPVDDTCVEIHLNLMFTIAAVATNVVALPVGAILDHFGPRICGIIGSLFLASGALTMAYAQRLPFDGFVVGYLLLALGGPFTFIPSFHLSNAFPQHSGLILALLTGAFDSSSALFLVYRVIYQSTGFGYHHFFLAYLVVPVFLLITQLTLMPKQSYKTVGDLVEQAEEAEAAIDADETDLYDDQVDENTALLREERRHQIQAVLADTEQLLGEDRADGQAQREEKSNEVSGVWGVMHAHSALEQIASPWFILICLFTVIQMTRINYFVATVRAQYEAIFGDHETAVEINNFFDMALPAGGVLSIPFIGLILDHTSTIVVLTVLVAVATAIGILGVLPFHWAAYLGICLFVLYRPFYYTAVSDYSAKVFGFRTFGTVYGTIICLSGVLNFSQSGLDFLFHQTFHGDPVPVNVMLLAVGFAVGVVLVTFVGIKSRGIRRKLLELEAEEVTRAP
ncbi:FMP42 protein [Sodiomyces alkalinus F11]|uniref:FMP42 protein n=1 Tax=Sodiomyces alkalinus (strain CBS 110278 / VKM F-3762 / F11) TaxID=1314773 RepID=A0A3N2Q070_SODAK|nr:FMP42 protein [Sodiomyces alkalinus F11]ROT40088.1 FMP42 protein [Sodiomyces alkalinus F11]